MKDFFKPVNKVRKFEKVSAGLDEWQKREAEQQILVPDKLEVYAGPLPKHKCALDKRVVRIVFPSTQDMEQVGKHLLISESFRGIKYITNISLIIEFSRQLDADPTLLERFQSFIHVGRHDVPITDIEDDVDDMVLEEDMEDEDE